MSIGITILTICAALWADYSVAHSDRIYKWPLRVFIWTDIVWQAACFAVLERYSRGSAEFTYVYAFGALLALLFALLAAAMPGLRHVEYIVDWFFTLALIAVIPVSACLALSRWAAGLYPQGKLPLGMTLLIGQALVLSVASLLMLMEWHDAKDSVAGTLSWYWMMQVAFCLGMFLSTALRVQEPIAALNDWFSGALSCVAYSYIGLHGATFTRREICTGSASSSVKS